MAASTGPIVVAGAIVVGNAVVVHERPPIELTSVAVGTLIAAGGLALWEQAMPRTATAIAWLALLSVLLVRVRPDVPAPVESLQQFLGWGK